MRPDLQLFLHIFGAIALFGSFLLLFVLGLAGRRTTGTLPGAAVATALAVAVPAWALTLIFGSWTKSKEKLPDGINWVEVPSGILMVGIVVIVAAAGISYSWKRRAAPGWQPGVLAVVSALYILGLGAAWWMMTAKVPS